MTRLDALNHATNRLRRSGITTASLDAEVVLAWVLKIDRAQLLAETKTELTTAQQRRYEKLVAQRTLGVPVAYLTGQKEFYGRRFLVTKQTLIPRPETELLVEEAITLAGKKPLRVAEIGTGSGCVAITLAKQLPKAIVFASDTSKPALAIARKNAKRHGVRVTFRQSNLLTKYSDTPVDMLISNLPYGTPTTMRQVLAHEPSSALLGGGKMGLGLYQKFFKQIAHRRQQPKVILLEFDPRQTKMLSQIVAKILPNYRLNIKKDLANLDRIAILKRQTIQNLN